MRRAFAFLRKHGFLEDLCQMLVFALLAFFIIFGDVKEREAARCLNRAPAQVLVAADEARPN